MDTHFPRPHGAPTPEETMNAEITGGMLQWEPGSLGSNVLGRVLTDALADLYADAYRQGEPQRDRNQRFLAELKRCVQHATGVDLISLTTTHRERR